MKTIRAILFDVDGTLFDRNKAQTAILDVIIGQMPDLFAGLAPAEVSRAFADSDHQVCEEFETGALAATDFRARRSSLFLEMLQLDTSWAARVTELYVTRYPTVSAPVVGAQDLVRMLADDFALGVVSDGLPVVQHQKLQALGVLQHFGCVVLSRDLGCRKPDPRIFLHAVSLLDVRPASCLCVGDLFERDVVGSKRAGMRACWFNPKGVRVGAQTIDADAEVQQLEQVWTVVRNLETRRSD